MSDYSKGLAMSQAGRDAYNSISVHAQPGTSFAGLRRYAQNLRTASLQKKAVMDDAIKEIQAVYTATAAAPKIKSIRDEYSAEVSGYKHTLTDALESIVNRKKEAVRDFSMKAPSEDILHIISSLNLRDKGSISETEWSYIVDATRGNYLAMRMLEGIATRQEIPFSVPFTPDQAVKDIDQLADIVRMAINNIDTPDGNVSNSMVIRFYNYDGQDGRIEDPFVSGLIKSIDGSAGTTVPENYKSLYSQLEQAAQKAFNKEEYRLFARINNFMQDNRDKLASPEEITEMLYSEARQYIDKANTPN